MEAKLDLIFEKLQDLKFRIEVLNKKESSRDDTRDRREENTNRRGMAKMK